MPQPVNAVSNNVGNTQSSSFIPTPNITNDCSLEQLQNQVSHMNQLMIMMMNKKGQRSFSSPEDQVNSIAGMAICSLSHVLPPTLSDSWIIDTGATHHMCCNKNLFEQLVTLTEPFHVRLPNTHILSVTQISDIQLTGNLSLKNVLYIPTFNCNLLSVSKLTQVNNCSVQFYPHHCVFQGQTPQRVLAFGEHHDGLYFFTQLSLHSTAISTAESSSHLAQASVHTLLCQTSSVPSAKMWHLRLGHPSDAVIRHLDFVYTSSLSCSDNCPICPLSEQCKLPFSIK